MRAHLEGYDLILTAEDDAEAAALVDWQDQTERAWSERDNDAAGRFFKVPAVIIRRANDTD